MSTENDQVQDNQEPTKPVGYTDVTPEASPEPEQPEKGEQTYAQRTFADKTKEEVMDSYDNLHKMRLRDREDFADFRKSVDEKLDDFSTVKDSVGQIMDRLENLSAPAQQQADDTPEREPEVEQPRRSRGYWDDDDLLDTDRYNNKFDSFMEDYDKRVEEKIKNLTPQVDVDAISTELQKKLDEKLLANQINADIDRLTQANYRKEDIDLALAMADSLGATSVPDALEKFNEKYPDRKIMPEQAQPSGDAEKLARQAEHALNQRDKLPTDVSDGQSSSIADADMNMQERFAQRINPHANKYDELN